jgi:hypothetical protein
VLDIIDDDVYAGLEGFLALVVPQVPWTYRGKTYPMVPILRGQQNRVPMPACPCVLMTTLGTPLRIGTNADSTEAVIVDGELAGFTAAVEADFEYSVQLDFYSPIAQSWAVTTELLWRDKIGVAAMPAGMKPLYSDSGRQLPIVGAENQWVQRWTMTLVLDYQPTWTQPTQAATTIVVIPEPIDVFFPQIPPGEGFYAGSAGPLAGSGSPPAGSPGVAALNPGEAFAAGAFAPPAGSNALPAGSA